MFHFSSKDKPEKGTIVVGGGNLVNNTSLSDKVKFATKALKNMNEKLEEISLGSSGGTYVHKNHIISELNGWIYIKDNDKSVISILKGIMKHYNAPTDTYTYSVKFNSGGIYHKMAYVDVTAEVMLNVDEKHLRDLIVKSLANQILSEVGDKISYDTIVPVMLNMLSVPDFPNPNFTGNFSSSYINNVSFVQEPDLDKVYFGGKVKKGEYIHTGYSTTNYYLTKTNHVSQMAKELPGMNELVNCPDCNGINKDPLYFMVQHLNDLHMWSREKIADWLDDLADSGKINIDFTWQDSPLGEDKSEQNIVPDTWKNVGYTNGDYNV